MSHNFILKPFLLIKNKFRENLSFRWSVMHIITHVNEVSIDFLHLVRPPDLAVVYVRGWIFQLVLQLGVDVQESGVDDSSSGFEVLLYLMIQLVMLNALLHDDY